MKDVVRWFLLVPFALGGCATSVQQRPASSQSRTEATPVVAQQAAPLNFNATNYSITAGGERIKVVQEDVGAHREELPLYLHLRLGLYQAEGKEWNQALARAGRDPSAHFDFGPSVWGLLSYYRASDGLEFLVDHVSMALWFRTEKGLWTCALSHGNVVKTFGGVFPRLPVCYVGSKRFLVAETLPGTLRDERIAFPKAQCATFLIDCGSGRVIDRTEAVVYDHNPPLVLPKDWEAKYDIRVEPVASPNAAPPHR
jgi:hypothetical protein